MARLHVGQLRHALILSAGQQGIPVRAIRVLSLRREEKVNLWAALVKITDIFVKAGKPGYALTLGLAICCMITIIVVLGG